MKALLKLALLIIIGVWIVVKCLGGGFYNSVESLYGTYTGTDKSGSRIKIELRSESDNEWRKFGTDYSDDLVYKDNRGRVRRMDSQLITWTWDLDDGYVQVYYNSSERYVIDLKKKKIYGSWGEYLDGRNGFSYTFSD